MVLASVAMIMENSEAEVAFCEVWLNVAQDKNTNLSFVVPDLTF